MFFHKDLLLQYFVAGTKVEGEDFELSLGDTEFGPTAPQHSSTENKIPQQPDKKEERLRGDEEK